MHGTEHKGTPWLEQPFSDTHRKPKCKSNDTQVCDYQREYWRFWYEADHRYTLPTVAFFLCVIILFAAAYLIAPCTPRTIRNSKTYRQLTALTRFLSYRAYRIQRLDWNSAPLGVLVLGAVGLIYFLCMTLGPKPYYWPNTPGFGNSPPIGTRSGWLSLACLPFAVATAGKSNLITLVTGVSHEKLQVFHRWIAYAFLVTALVHAFPFIIHNIEKGTMVKKWNTVASYWTGVVAILALAWLNFTSMGPLRSLNYEWFKFSHFVAALVFILFLFFHCDHILSSWDYFIATGVLFSLSWLHRQIRLYVEHGVGHRATISLTSAGFICVRVPTTSHWGLGQHFFVRFMGLGVHAATNHPFTACSLPAAGSSARMATSELVLYIRARGGTTARLAHFAEAHPNGSMRVLLDGPYGGIQVQKVAACAQQLIIAGGSGAGWVLPLLQAFLVRHGAADSSDPSATATLHARVVFVTRDAALRKWFESALCELLAEHGLEKAPAGLEVDLYYTGTHNSANHSHATETFPPQLLDISAKGPMDIVPDASSKSETSSNSDQRFHIRNLDSRPDLPALIRSEAARTLSASAAQLGVFVCGPLGMQSDVSNAVAAEQWTVLRGGPKDIYLHMEHFAWA